MESLVQQFMDRYLSREEIAYRLPVSIPISQFWPAMEEARKKAAILLPLKAQNGQPFWFVINKTIEAQCDVVAEIARRSFVFDERKLFHFSYQRYLENCIRNVFGLEGTPVIMSIREKGDKED